MTISITLDNRNRQPVTDHYSRGIDWGRHFARNDSARRVASPPPPAEVEWQAAIMEVTRAGVTRGRSRCRVVTLRRLIGQLACRRRETDMSQTDLIVSSCGAAYNNAHTFLCLFRYYDDGGILKRAAFAWTSSNFQTNLDLMKFIFRYMLTVFQDGSKAETYSSQTKTVLECTKRISWLYE